MFIEDECDGPGGGDFDGSSSSDDEQHAGGQLADEQTTDGLYVTEAGTWNGSYLCWFRGEVS